MDIDYTVAALMFPAIPLMMTMYSNRFHTLSALIRQLHDKYTFEKKVPPELENQLHVLNKRTNYLKYVTEENLVNYDEGYYADDDGFDSTNMSLVPGSLVVLYESTDRTTKKVSILKPSNADPKKEYGFQSGQKQIYRGSIL